jgi:hypothetical protein
MAETIQDEPRFVSVIPDRSICISKGGTGVAYSWVRPSLSACTTSG